MNRRDFIAIATAIGLTPWCGDLAFAQQATHLRVRRNATSIDAASDITTLRKGVEIMMANKSSSDYASWMYWANSHGTPDPVPDAMANVWYRCQHGTPHFISWHRAYLFFFESLIRELTQSEKFALPYWNWYESTTVPMAYAEKTIGGSRNWLHHELRNPNNRALTATAMTQADFYRFSGTLEGNPHGTVHVMVGGDMGAVETSGRDPLFWAHHAQIDRLWAAWLQLDAARSNPQDARWRDQAFAFDTGGQKSLQTSAMLDPTTLGYRYDFLDVAGLPIAEAPARPANSLDISVSTNTNFNVLSLPGPLSAPAIIGQKSSISLDGASLELRSSVPVSAANRMSTMSVENRATNSLVLILEGVSATKAGVTRGAEYRVYVNLPAQGNREYKHDDFYLGAINTFSLSHHGGTHPQTFRFNLDELAPRLAKYNLWDTGRVSISLISDALSAGEPLIQIDDAHIELSSGAIVR